MPERAELRIHSVRCVRVEHRERVRRLCGGPVGPGRVERGEADLRLVQRVGDGELVPEVDLRAVRVDDGEEDGGREGVVQRTLAEST